MERSRPATPVGVPNVSDPARPALRRIRAASLLEGAREVIIELDMETEYRLRLTRAGKLILTK
jgi:hemin uptake protein HemP